MKHEPVLKWVALGQAAASLAEVYMPASGIWHGVSAMLTALVARGAVRPLSKDAPKDKPYDTRAD